MRQLKPLVTPAWPCTACMIQTVHSAARTTLQSGHEPAIRALGPSLAEHGPVSECGILDVTSCAATALRSRVAFIANTLSAATVTHAAHATSAVTRARFVLTGCTTVARAAYALPCLGVAAATAGAVQWTLTQSAFLALVCFMAGTLSRRSTANPMATTYFHVFGREAK